MPPMEPLRFGGSAATDKTGPPAGSGTSAADHIRFYNYGLSASQVSSDATCTPDDTCKTKLNLGSAETTPPYLDYLRKPVAADVVVDPNGLLELQSGLEEPLEYQIKTILADAAINLKVSTTAGEIAEETGTGVATGTFNAIFNDPGTYVLTLQMTSGSAVATDRALAHVYRPGSGLKHKGRFVALRGSPFDLMLSASNEYDDFDKQYTLSATFVLDSATGATCNVLRLAGDNMEVQIDAAASTFTVLGGGGKTDPIAYLQDGSFKERHVLQVTRLP